MKAVAVAADDVRTRRFTFADVTRQSVTLPVLMYRMTKTFYVINVYELRKAEYSNWRTL